MNKFSLSQVYPNPNTNPNYLLYQDAFPNQAPLPSTQTHFLDNYPANINTKTDKETLSNMSMKPEFSIYKKETQDTSHIDSQENNEENKAFVNKRKIDELKKKFRNDNCNQESISVED